MERTLREIEIENRMNDVILNNNLMVEYVVIQQLGFELSKENPKLNLVNIICSIDIQHKLNKITDKFYYLTMNRLYIILLENISDVGYEKVLNLYNILLNNTKEN